MVSSNSRCLKPLWFRFEVMGYLQGKVTEDGTFIIMDSLQVDAAFSEVIVAIAPPD